MRPPMIAFPITMKQGTKRSTVKRVPPSTIAMRRPKGGSWNVWVELFRKAGIEIVLDECAGRYEAAAGLGPQRFGQEAMRVERDPVVLTASTTHVEGDRLGLVALIECSEPLGNVLAASVAPRYRERLEKTLVVFGGSPVVREPGEPLVTRIDEDVNVEPSRVIEIGSDVLEDGVRVELVAGDDPHRDAVLAHHGQ